MQFAVRLLVVLVTVTPLGAAKYKIRKFEPDPATEMRWRQDFQGVVIAARAFTDPKEILKLLDSNRILKREILPVLVVIDNRSGDVLRLAAADIFLTGPDGSSRGSIPPGDVMLRIALKKPLSYYSTRREILLRQIPPNMFEDFRHKALGEKLIAPDTSDWGVVFFDLPPGDLAGHRLYLPQIDNLTSGETLMFFDFALAPEN